MVKGIIVFSKIQLVCQVENSFCSFCVKIRISSHCFDFQSRRFSLLVGYNFYPTSSLGNPIAALIIDHWLDSTNIEYSSISVCNLVTVSLPYLFQLLIHFFSFCREGHWYQQLQLTEYCPGMQKT